MLRSMRSRYASTVLDDHIADSERSDIWRGENLVSANLVSKSEQYSEELRRGCVHGKI